MEQSHSEKPQEKSDMGKAKEFIYQGKVKIVSLPQRKLSPESEYPELIGMEGKIVAISGNRLGIAIDNKYNKHSQFGWYWFDSDCVEKIDTIFKCTYLLPCGWCTKYDCPCDELTEKSAEIGGVGCKALIYAKKYWKTL